MCQLFFLTLAPALYMPGYKQKYCTGHKYLEIVHGWSDDIIPPEHSIRYAKEAECPTEVRYEWRLVHRP